MVFRSSLFTAACGALLACSGSAVAVDPNMMQSSDELCSLVPYSYASAKQTNPELSFAIDEVSKHSIATWYSDRNSDYETVAQRLVSTCPEDKRLSVVVYGLPNKDCEAGYSSSGSRVQNSDDYKRFLQNLMDVVKDRKVLYVVEPDAVGLLAKEGGCGEAAGYRENLKTAIQMLSQNPNAELYLDVGYWTLAYDEPRQRVVEVIKNLLSGGGRVKGITLNTSNYRKTEEIADLCTQFQTTMGGAAQMNCIIDTSRNYRGSPSSEWCNVGSAGIGAPPTSNTGLSNIDYFLWIKPVGESDGTCDGAGHTADATRGPNAGDFFVDGFKKLWDYGYFVDSMNMAKFDGSAPAPTPDPTSFYQTSAPVTPEPTPETTTSTPVTSAPDVTTSAPDATTVTPETTTSTPVTAAPEVTTSAPETTTASPSVTTPSPVLDSSKTPSVTPTPDATTMSPSSGATDVPSTTPVVSKSPVVDSSSSGSSIGSPSVGITTPRPSLRHTKKPKTPVPTTPEPTSETPSTDMVQNTTPAVDAGPSTIAGNPNLANTKSSSGSSSATGGIIAAVLIAAVALAVAAAVFIHIRRRAQDATADDMKTPVTMDPTHPAYLSQL